jgi:hypothetical protein
MSKVHFCSFSSGLDDLPRRKQKDFAEVLRVLHRTGRFSLFEATADQAIARTMTDLEQLKLIETTPKGYPWSDVKLTKAGIERAGLVEP